MLLKPRFTPRTLGSCWTRTGAPLQISGKTCVTKVNLLPQILPVCQKLSWLKAPGGAARRGPEAPGQQQRGRGTTIFEVGGTRAPLQRNIVPAAIPGTNVLQVTYYGGTPEEAQKTLELVVNQYIYQQSLVESRCAETVGFLSKRIRRERRLDCGRQRNSRRSGKQRTGPVSVKEQITGQLRVFREPEG